MTTPYQMSWRLIGPSLSLPVRAEQTTTGTSRCRVKRFQPSGAKAMERHLAEQFART